MALMETHIDTANTLRASFGQQTNTTGRATSISNSMNIPVDGQADLILEYTSMNGSISVKQADVVLVDDFLNFPNAYSLSDLDYYAGKQSATGPGMTYAVFSSVANAHSPSGCSSYTYGIYASHPYVRAPWFQYSEQLLDDYTANGGTHPAYPFLTGMGGAHRVALFGFLGLRLRLDSLNVDPSLPPQLTRLDYRTFYWQGHAINATSNATHTTLRRIAGKTLPHANAAYATNPIPVTIGLSNSTTTNNNNNNNIAYQLPATAGAEVVIPNRAIGSVKTWPGNIAQCRPVVAAATSDFAPGQFPFAAVDGAVSTKWQPVAANTSASVVVDLGPAAVGQVVTGFRFDWAQAPPRGYSVGFSNTTTGTGGGGGGAGAQGQGQGQGLVNVTSSQSVEVSSPFNAATVGQIMPYASNTTNVTMGMNMSMSGSMNGSGQRQAPVYAGRYATLTIWGNQATGDNGVGATVAEFAVIVGGSANNTGNGTATSNPAPSSPVNTSSPGSTNSPGGPGSTGGTGGTGGTGSTGGTGGTGGQRSLACRSGAGGRSLVVLVSGLLSIMWLL